MEMEGYIEELNRRKEKAKLLGGEKKITQQHELGRLTSRERIDKLVDPGSFMELGMLNHSSIPGMEEKSPADGIAGGIAKINGRTVVVESYDKTVFAGTEGSVGTKKTKTLHTYA
ncbi:carboxyl transferase domain-containing protein, partial [Thermodesulfobacteriota bacterium]